MIANAQRSPWIRAVLYCVLALGTVGHCLSSSIPATAEWIASPDPGWPQFRGPNRDGVSRESGLLKSWPADGPRELWKASGIGHGFSSPVISGDRLVITGDDGDELRIVAFNLEGREVWRASNGFGWRRPYPGARSSPTISEGRVYHLNAHGRLACFDAENGRELWAVPLLERFGGRNITWGLSECPLVDERAVYATPGGSKALMVALDKRTGELLWQSEPLRSAEKDSGAEKEFETAGYVSPILIRFNGRRLLVGCSLRQLFALDADTGKFQWVVPRPTQHSVLAMPPVLMRNAVFMAAPHGPPGTLYQLVPAGDDGRIGVSTAWTTRLDTCQGGVVHVDGRLYGSYYPGRKGWAAVDAATGEVLFENSSITKGSVLHADERLYVLSEDGWMYLLEPRDDRFVEHGRFRLAEANSDAWAHPVIFDGRLYLRYHDELRCFQVRN